MEHSSNVNSSIYTQNVPTGQDRGRARGRRKRKERLCLSSKFYSLKKEGVLKVIIVTPPMGGATTQRRAN